MPAVDLLAHRLFNQQLVRPRFAAPSDLVAWFGAVQAQEYPDALWSLGQRLSAATQAGLIAAFNAGEILRTHVLRPTWHFVAPADLRWLLALTAPRVQRFNASLYRKYELDAAAFKRCHAVFTRALRGGQHLTRQELRLPLKRAGIERDSVGASLIFMHAELDGLICSGPRRGKQFTYALLEERVPPAPAFDRDAALAALANRYVQSHGPVQARDFAWWSGLTLADARAGLALLGDRLACETIDGREFWFFPAQPPAPPPAAFLLPTYDEFGIAYKDRTDIYDPADAGKTEAGYSAGFANYFVLAGRVAGLWRRVLRARTVCVTLKPWRALWSTEQRALRTAAERYACFLGLTLELSP